LETTTAITRTTATASNRKPRSLCLTKYIKNIQQANKRTAAEYEYRLSKFEKYIVASYQHQEYQQQDQIIASLDQVIEELKKGSNKIDPCDLLSGFVAYIQEEQLKGSISG
jgi:peroxiredoxin family protein